MFLQSATTRRAARTGFSGLLTALLLFSTARAQGPAAGELLTGTIDLLEVDNPGDMWSSGRMVVNGQVILLPRNLLIDLPANRLTLQQLFSEAPPDAHALGKSGLATLDGVGTPGLATVHANRTSFGNAIAGDVFIEKGPEIANGMVTFVNHTDGYLRIDGIVGDDTTGLMIRINDPSGRHTIQKGKGCAGGPNCSADPRFTLDPDNYTVTFITGYPAGIPSTVPLGQRPGFRSGDNPSAASSASGVGDPFCPSTNRGANPVPDSTRFAPIQIGDFVTAEGNFETVADVYFLSAHTLTVSASLTTQDSPTQPDYMIFDEVGWDVPAFDNLRTRLLLIGFTTLPTSQLDVFALHVNRNTNANVEFPLASTVGNPLTINAGVGGGAGGIFKIRYDVDFRGRIDPRLSPCVNLANAGFPPCPLGGALQEEFGILSPVSREVQGRTRHHLDPGVITRDINGRQATNGQYLTPVGLDYPFFPEINLAGLQTPFAFDGIPWNLDRRLSPGGCDGNCGNTPQPLDPFPWSGLDPSRLAPNGAAEIFSFFPFTPGSRLSWPPRAPASFPILPTPKPAKTGPVAPPSADFSASNTAGTVPLLVSFTDLSTGNVNARLWDFGDGTFSIAQNPTHTYITAGSFNVSLTALGQGGSHTVTRPGVVAASNPSGPGAPVANFTQNLTAGDVPLTVNFSNLTTGSVTSFAWTFGDGATSTLANPSHVYSVAGRFTVTLTATGPGGSNAITRPDLITANQPGALDLDFRAQPRLGSAPMAVLFKTQILAGQGPISGTWNFGDGATAPANGQDVSHTYTTAGRFTVTLTASNGVGSDTVTKPGFVVVR